jgi:hypothetical protein
LNAFFVWAFLWQLGDALRKVVALHAGLLQEMADSGAAPPAMGEDASANKVKTVSCIINR